jgi:hypothetical protein
MNAYGTNPAAGVWFRDLWEIRRADPEKYEGVSQNLVWSKLAEIMGKTDLKQPSDSASNSEKPGIDAQTWSAIVSMVPNIEQLGREAGYVDVRHQASWGLAMSLNCADIRREKSLADVGTEILGTKMLSYTLQNGIECDWERVVSTLGRDVPMVVQTVSGHSYIVVGFYVPASGERYLFGYTPEEAERSVWYGGREMMESRFASFKKDNPPQPSWPREVYQEVLSTHKEYQFPGFCMLRFNERMRFTFIENVTVDTVRIRELNLKALEAALQDLALRK